MATFFKKRMLLKGLLDTEHAYTGPFHVMLDVTRRCNLRCVGCRFHSPEVHRPSAGDQGILDISLDMFRSLCWELNAMGTRTLFLLGDGEPLLCEHIFDIISIAKGLDFHVTMLTNGTLLDEEKVELLLNSRLDVLQVSFWAASRKDYERQYPGAAPQNFDKVVAGLKLIESRKAGLRSVSPEVILHQPINRFNFQEIDSMVELAQATGCEAISFAPFLSTQGKMNSYKLSSDEERSVRQHLLRLKKRLHRSSLKVLTGRALLRYAFVNNNGWPFPCYVGWFHSRIRVDGMVLPCGPCEIPVGDLKEKSFHEIWNGPAYRDFRKKAMTRQGLNALSHQCDCEHCCYAQDNLRTYRLFKWLTFLRNRRMS